MLNTLVHNMPVHMGLLRAIYIATHVYAGKYNGPVVYV